MSSYQDFIVNALKNTASKTELQSAVDDLLVVDESNNISSGKFKDLFESMGLTEDVPNGNGKVKGKNMSTSLDSIQTTLDEIQTSISALTARVETLESVPDDTTVPVITLLGDASITINQGSTYTDAGATASDNIDGDLTSSIVVGGLDTLDTNLVGYHTITYNVTDSSGNAATPVTRTISVISTTYININTNGFVSIVDGDYYLTENPNNSSNFTQNPLDTALVWSRNDGVDGKIYNTGSGSWVVVVNGTAYIWTGNTEQQQIDGFYIYGRWRAEPAAYTEGYISEADWSFNMNVGDNIGTLIQPDTTVDTTVPVVGSPASLFTWDNNGQVQLVQLQEEYTQSFKSNNQNKTLAFGASSFSVPMDKLDIYNYDTSKLLTVGDFYDININGSDFKLRIDRVRTNVSALANNVIVPDTENTFNNNTNISQSYNRIRLGGSWVYNFYRIVGAYYDADSIYTNIFTCTVPQDNTKYYEVDYILPHTSDSAQDILLTFPVYTDGIVANVKHKAFTFDTNYYSFDNDGNFVLNTMTFQEARQYGDSNWTNRLGSSTDITTYGVSISLLGSNWFVGNGKVVDSLIEFNPELNGISVFNSTDISQNDGLKLIENVVLQGYIQNKEDISLYDGTGTTPIENLDFTFNQIDLNNSYQLTDVVQSFLPSSGFKINTSEGTSVTLDSNITYKIDNVDVTNDEITIDDVTEITAHPFLTSV